MSSQAVELVSQTIAAQPVSRGLAIVVANRESRVFPHEPLDGVVKDIQNLVEAFQNLRYAVIPLFDAPKDFIVDVVKAVAEYFPLCEEEDPRFKRIVFSFAGHGDKYDEIHSFDGEINVNKEVMWPLLPKECPRLRRIPKLFFIDACRGENDDRPVPRGPGNKHVFTRVSGMANYLLVRSTLPSMKAFETGSKQGGYWTLAFVEELLNPLNKGRDIGFILIEVNRKVNTRFNLPNHDLSQQAITENTLLDHVFFWDEAKQFEASVNMQQYVALTQPSLYQSHTAQEPSARVRKRCCQNEFGHGPVDRDQSSSGTYAVHGDNYEERQTTIQSPLLLGAPAAVQRGPFGPLATSTEGPDGSKSAATLPKEPDKLSPMDELEHHLKDRCGGNPAIEYKYKPDRSGHKATVYMPILGFVDGDASSSKAKAQRSAARKALSELLRHQQ